MELNDKIKQILVDKSISPSHFADEIGVQRSSISHILAGRNRPSLDIIQKIIRRYPDLGMEWILEDEDLVESKNKPTPYATGEKTNFLPPNPPTRRGLELAVPKQPGGDTIHENARDIENIPLQPKTVERILIFYTDGTFSQYTPAN